LRSHRIQRTPSGPVNLDEVIEQFACRFLRKRRVPQSDRGKNGVRGMIGATWPIAQQ